MGHRFHFFRAGGVDQVSLRDGADLLALPELDQKLWAALAMPTRGIDLDPETLGLLDADADGRIRVQTSSPRSRGPRRRSGSQATCSPPGPRSSSRRSSTPRSSPPPSACCPIWARRSHGDHRRRHHPITKAFSETVLNGDGIVIPASTDDTELQKVIEDAITCVGAVVDRSGKPGIDQALADKLFAEVDAYAAWLVGRGDAIAVLGDRTATAPPRSPPCARRSTTTSHGAGSLRSTARGRRPLWPRARSGGPRRASAQRR